MFASKPLPERLGIYFHALEPHDHAAFSDAIGAIRQAGYAIVPLTAYLDETRRDKRAWISFDDNYASWHRAIPLLATLDVTATFYVNTMPFRDTAHRNQIDDYFNRIDHHGDRTTMTCAEFKELAAAGHDIGCHTHTHPVLSNVPRAEWDAEIVACRDQLEALAGRSVPHFSYPYGMRRHFSGALADYCRDAGFSTIAAAIPGLQFAAFDPLNLQRTRWLLSETSARNLADLGVDGRRFEQLTGRSAIG